MLRERPWHWTALVKAWEEKCSADVLPILPLWYASDVPEHEEAGTSIRLNYWLLSLAPNLALLNAFSSALYGPRTK